MSGVTINDLKRLALSSAIGGLAQLVPDDGLDLALFAVQTLHDVRAQGELEHRLRVERRGAELFAALVNGDIVPRGETDASTDLTDDEEAEAHWVMREIFEAGS